MCVYIYIYIYIYIASPGGGGGRSRASPSGARRPVQGYRAHKKQPAPRTLRQDF